MQPGRIPVDQAVAVTEPGQFIFIFIKSRILSFGNGQGNHAFNQRSAVQAVELADKPFGRVAFQRSCHVGRTEERLADPQHLRANVRTGGQLHFLHESLLQAGLPE
ncbi:hypothetical protein D3C86_2002920 [compost metagenome]